VLRPGPPASNPRQRRSARGGTGPDTVTGVVTIRPARPDDAAAVADIWAQTWQATYAGVMPADFLAGVTGPQGVTRRTDQLARELADERCRQGLIVAETAGPAETSIVGYARFGPERDADGPARPLPATPADGAKAELYAIYVRPRVWSTGAGRCLLAEVIERVSALRYGTLSLWVLEANTRARRFYERAGFAVTGESKTEDRFASVAEIRYARPLG
jgi:ribosomal protein S18 acetylase RimI-like enzyme